MGNLPLQRCDTLHVDDTPVPVLAPGTGKTKTGRLWTYVRDERPFAGLSRKSELAQAFRYMRARWTALVRCFDDGRLALDNNPAERALPASPLAVKIICLPAPMPAAAAPPRSMH